MWYMFRVQCEELRINHLTPLLVVAMPYTCWFLWHVDCVEDFKWCLHFQFEVAFWRAIMSEVYYEGPNCVWKALKTSILTIGWTDALLFNGHVTHETGSPWPLLHFKRCHWWKRWSRSKFVASHYAWGTSGDWEPVTILTLQALSLVEKAEPVQVRFTLGTLEGPTETESPWPLLHFKRSHWWKRRSRSKFASH